MRFLKLPRRFWAESEFWLCYAVGAESLPPEAIVSNRGTEIPDGPRTMTPCIEESAPLRLARRDSLCNLPP